MSIFLKWEYALISKIPLSLIKSCWSKKCALKVLVNGCTLPCLLDWLWSCKTQVNQNGRLSSRIMCSPQKALLILAVCWAGFIRLVLIASSGTWLNQSNFSHLLAPCLIHYWFHYLSPRLAVSSHLCFKPTSETLVNNLWSFWSGLSLLL